MRKLKRAGILLFIMGNLYGILCGGLYFFQENLLFLPSILPQEYTYTFSHDYEEIYLDQEDGARLNGLYFKVANPKGTILYFHGNAGDLQRWGEITSFFVAKDYNVIVMDYRGYGKSTGQRSEKMLYADSDLWYAFAKANTPESQLIVYGRSLGTTFATYVASRNNPQNLVLETPFYSIEHEAKSRFPILPVKKLLKFKMPTYTFINEVKAPITFFHGTDDDVVNYDHGQRLFTTLTTNQKEFITIPDGGHNNLVIFPEYLDSIDSVLEKR